jgi:hypothetical protein
MKQLLDGAASVFEGGGAPEGQRVWPAQTDGGKLVVASYHARLRLQKIRSADVRNSSERQFLAPLIFVCRFPLHSS